VTASACFKEVFGSEYHFFGQDYTPIPKRPAMADVTSAKIAAEVASEVAAEVTSEVTAEVASEVAHEATAEVTSEDTRDMIAQTSGGRWWRRMLDAISIFSFRGPKA
jgi:hypothetical protein